MVGSNDAFFRGREIAAGLVRVKGEGEEVEKLTRTLRTNFLSFIDISVGVYDCGSRVQ